jgi:vacuolar protein sorting-associated protein 35
MHKALDSNNMKEALKYSDVMLSELRAENFTPKDYYALFFIIFDELSRLQKSLANEPKVKKLNLYDTVQ